MSSQLIDNASINITLCMSGFHHSLLLFRSAIKFCIFLSCSKSCYLNGYTPYQTLLLLQEWGGFGFVNVQALHFLVEDRDS